MQVQKFNSLIDLLRANIWQYDNADEWLELIEQKSEWYSLWFEGFWRDWYEKVFRLEIDYSPTNVNHTHTSLFGCVVWAIILDFPLDPILVPRDGLKVPWSFENVGTTPIPGVSRENFGPVEDPATSGLGGNFSAANNPVALSILEKVQILKLVYYGYIGGMSVPQLNRALADVFKITGLTHLDSSGNPDPIYQTPYVVDEGNMTIKYVFPYHLSDTMKTNLVKWNVLPKPAGVNLVIQYPTP